MIIVFSVRLFLSLLMLVFCLWPYWLYLAVDGLLQPAGFWQNAFMLVGWVYFFGLLQLVFIVLWIFLLHSIWIAYGQDRRGHKTKYESR